MKEWQFVILLRGQAGKSIAVVKLLEGKRVNEICLNIKNHWVSKMNISLYFWKRGDQSKLSQ